MIFAAPALLLALAFLPLLWWLLRATPPAPKLQRFPAIRLLAGLRRREETPARTPWWLLALRMLAAGLIILGLAGPVLDSDRAAMPGTGPMLLVIDDGWAAAADWPARLDAAQSALDRAERAGRPVQLLTLARDEADRPPRPGPAVPVAELRAHIGALRPKPWPADRGEAATALAASGGPSGPVVYIADGIADAGDQALGQALASRGPVTELTAATPRVTLLLPPRAEPDQLVVKVARLASPLPAHASVLAESGDGRALARVGIDLPAGSAGGEAPLDLPIELRNQVNRLTLEGPPSAGSVALIDERFRRRPVGLVASDQGAQTPLIGQLFYLERALGPTAEVREGDISTLLARPISVIMLADRPLTPDEAERLGAWVDQGGLLVRFAGPHLAESVDGLVPVQLIAGDRQLGGAMSWSQPATLAPFPAGSPFAGLPVPKEVTVTRQVLAEPAPNLAARSWARLADGTPLVTEAPRGHGRIVLFHITANADWSNLPLSGLFVEMMSKLVKLSVGVASAEDNTVLAPAETLDGAGVLGVPPPAARGLAAGDFATTAVSPRHPPGLYGPETDRRSLNLANALPALAPAAPVPGAHGEHLGAQTRARPLGPYLIAAALALLAADMVISLALRGLLRPAMAALLLCVIAPAARAETSPALSTHLAYVITGDPQVDGVSKAGLEGLSDYVNRRTAAQLSDPAAVTPGEDDLSFYPLLYWPITDAATSSPRAIEALNGYMTHGGIILIDTRGAGIGGEGSGAGFAPGSAAALQRAAQGLVIPPLTPLTTDHVLARAFYLLSDFPGRYDGATVWVQRDGDRANDSVSPVVIGGNDWAAAWAIDANGDNPYATIPGGARQRTLAYRFGVNLVMYALTGNYKGDQVHVPAILERLGQ